MVVHSVVAPQASRPNARLANTRVLLAAPQFVCLDRIGTALDAEQVGGWC